MSEQPAQTEQTIPAGPTSPRQRQYLMALISDTTDLCQALGRVRDAAASELGDLADATIPPKMFGNGAISNESAAITRLRAQIQVRADVFRAYDLAPEQVYYAIKVGSMSGFGAREEAETSWLFNPALGLD